MLALFPSDEVWREGHIGIPFSHWFKKQQGYRLYYVLLMRVIGLGYGKQKKPIYKWCQESIEWLDNWTHYRPTSQIDFLFKKYFSAFDHIEERWFDARILKIYLSLRFKRAFVRKFVGLVVTCKK